MPQPKIIQTSMYLRPEQIKKLNKLKEITRIPRAVLIREAVDDLLKKYTKTLKGGAK